jgi:hypothetical protein
MPILAIVVYCGIRLCAGRSLFRRTLFDVALLLFGLTSLVGVWAAYSREAAWEKFWMLLLALCWYYAIASQPQENFWGLSALLGLCGLWLSLNFLLVYDWRELPADFRLIYRIGLAWMRMRPTLPGETLSANAMAGVLASLFPITLALGIAAWRQRRLLRWAWLWLAWGALCAGVMALTITLTSSRGAWAALAAGLGFWLTWALGEKLLAVRLERQKFAMLAGGVVSLLSIGALLALSGSLERILNLVPGLPTGQSRLGIDALTLPLIGDFPFTGGGLGAFPGLFSQYMLVIPSVMFRYAHNLYLDVAVEQGLLGLLMLLVIWAGSAVLLLRSPEGDPVKPGIDLLRQAALVSLIVMAIHGVVDDPLYGESGTPLIWVAAGLAVFVHPQARTLRHLLPSKLIRWSGLPGVRRRIGWAAGLLALLIAVGGALAWRPLAAGWLANLGAVRMAQVELRDFPSNEWLEPQVAEELGDAQRLLEQAVSLAPADRTANHRLGLIALLRQDFSTAIAHLQLAHRADPRHRGVVKNLGYAYVWVGEYDRAQALLAGLPEAHIELGYYVDWWAFHGRRDLAQRAKFMADRLSSYHSVPAATLPAQPVNAKLSQQEGRKP